MGTRTPKQEAAPSLLHVMARVSRALKASAQTALERHGVHAGQSFILERLWARDGQTTREIADAIGVEGPTVVRAVQRMAAAGLVVRKDNPTDGRLVAIHLTPTGSRLRKVLPGILHAVEEAALAELQEYAKISLASNASLDEVRAVWETNVFGVLAVYQALLPLLRLSSDARIVNVSSGVGSLATNANPAFAYHKFYGPIYPASKTALNAMTLAMMVELESTGIKVNLVSPGFTKTNLNGYEGTESVEDGSREVVRVAQLGPDGPTGTFTRWENTDIPW